MDDAGGPVRLVWKWRRPSPCAPWRWELRRALDTMYESRNQLKYNKLISQALPQWSILWRDVGVESPSSYWPSRRSVLGRDVDLSLVDEEYSVDTAALVHTGTIPRDTSEWAHASPWVVLRQFWFAHTVARLRILGSATGLTRILCSVVSAIGSCASPLHSQAGPCIATLGSGGGGAWLGVRPGKCQATSLNIAGANIPTSHSHRLLPSSIPLQVHVVLRFATVGQHASRARGRRMLQAFLEGGLVQREDEGRFELQGPSVEDSGLCGFQEREENSQHCPCIAGLLRGWAPASMPLVVALASLLVKLVMSLGCATAAAWLKRLVLGISSVLEACGEDRL